MRKLETGPFLAVVAETGLQFFACSEDSAFDSAEGEPHVVGDFIVFVTCNMHREWNAVFFGKFVDGSRNFLSSVRAFGRFDARVLAEVEVIEIVVVSTTVAERTPRR